MKNESVTTINLTEKLKKNFLPYPRTRGRYNASELYAIFSGWVTPETWLEPKEKTIEEIMRMWNGIWDHQRVQSLLKSEFCEVKREYVLKERGFTCVGKADYLNPDAEEVWEFKTSDTPMTKAKPWHLHQARLYCTMFEKPVTKIFQPVFNKDGVSLVLLDEVRRDDEWFKKQMDALEQFHKKLESLWEKRGSAPGNLIPL